MVFISQDSGRIKYLAYPKIRRPKSYRSTFTFLVASGGFLRLVSTQLPDDLILECSDGSIFIYCYISTRCCFWFTASKRGTHFKQMFLQNSGYIAFWYLKGVSYLTELQFTVFQNAFVDLFMFSGITAEFGRPKRSASSVLVRPRLNSATNIRWSEVPITLNKPLFCLNGIFWK